MNCVVWVMDQRCGHAVGTGPGLVRRVHRTWHRPWQNLALTFQDSTITAKINGTTVGTVTDTNNGSNDQRRKLVKVS
ncbi:hypothetical protein ABTX62_11760 [Streptomyces sp. NPDC096046]|uniref:hypothetical protein n=1 Tax=Streptomyces sp. NPDC096046 TaxID=3155542 RepID=UPI003333AD84